MIAFLFLLFYFINEVMKLILKTIILTFVFLFMWLIFGCFYYFGLKTDALTSEFPKETVYNLVSGSLVTSILFTFYFIVYFMMTFKFKNNKFFNYHAFFLSLLICSILYFAGIHWSIALACSVLSYPVFLKYNFNSNKFIFSTTITYIIVLFLMLSVFEGYYLTPYLRLFFFFTYEANHYILTVSYVSIFIGIVFWFFEKKKVNFVMSYKEIKESKNKMKSKKKFNGKNRKK